MEIAIFAKSPNREIIKYYENNFPNHSIKLVSPKPLEINSRTIFKRDDEILKFEDFAEAFSCNIRPKWYYQQFLKLATVAESSYTNTWVIDGDTYVAPRLYNRPICQSGAKNMKHYNDFHSKLISDLKPPSLNFITNQMKMEKAILAEIIRAADCINLRDLIKKCGIIQAEHPTLRFSEYHLYATYALTYLSVPYSNTKVFRRLDLLSNANPLDALQRYDIASFEPAHGQTLAHKLRARMYYNLGVNLN